MTSKTRTKIRAAAKVDAYQLVTDRICDALEAGFVPWHRPWKSVASGDGHRSLSTRKPYRGINVWVLEATAFANGYESKWWGTYRQISELGGQVRKGEKATPVVFWKIIEKKDDGGSVVERMFFLRHFMVFNADQCDGELRVPATPEVELADHDEIEVCSEIVARYCGPGGGPRIEHGGNVACYSPAFDWIKMPLIGQFDDADAYYATLFHEAVHSTGHDSRLKRPEVVSAGSFGDENYSKEELVAEMGAAFICGVAGIDTRVPQHAAYIASWLGKFRSDTKLLVQAAGAAQRAADLIVGRPDETAGDGEEG